MGLFAIAVSLAYAGGSAEKTVTDSGETRTIVHELGETAIGGTPQRVVVLELSFVDALASVGLSPVGIADDNNRSLIIPKIAKIIGDEWVSVGTRKQPSLERILSLEPDLIIADFKRHSSIYKDLSQIAPTIVLKSLQASYEENLASMPVIGAALGHREAVERRLDLHTQRMEELSAKVPVGDQRKFLSAVVWDEGFNVHTSSAYTGGVLVSIGLTSAVESDEPYARINLETLSEINPDIMFLMVGGGHTLVDDWQDNPLWKNLEAVGNGTVFEMNRDLWSKFRGIIAAEEIAADAIEALY